MIRTFAFAALAAVTLTGAALTGAAFAQDGTTPATPPAATAPAAPAPTFVTNCPALPAVPPIPDGATARDRDMAAADAAIQAWNSQYVDVMNTCRQAEVLAAQREMQAAEAAARAAQAQYRAALDQYNVDGRVATDAGARWMAQVDAFNAANTRPRR